MFRATDHAPVSQIGQNSLVKLLLVHHKTSGNLRTCRHFHSPHLQGDYERSSSVSPRSCRFGCNKGMCNQLQDIGMLTANAQDTGCNYPEQESCIFLRPSQTALARRITRICWCPPPIAASSRNCCNLWLGKHFGQVTASGEQIDSTCEINQHCSKAATASTCFNLSIFPASCSLFVVHSAEMVRQIPSTAETVGSGGAEFEGSFLGLVQAKSLTEV